ncbi:NAD(P)/FAD-dependent oxidoreductase [Flammeovirga aprica]|uniref:FAD-dependent oxidoreductase n=1 Tax=Flammeovirga aprica JL-4 TaxID=694437 RepID=A0A7X9P1V0_9BACT|nr:NAD(P)/FAD-dependent oxidoreductase [Flammeovirga aprica]NME67477.1 FAD-dependent oxidoreductase [Flammeovirga aprica JL-4]
MKRRYFLQLSSTALLGVLAGCDSKEEYPFEIEVRSDDKVGHLVYQSKSFPKEEAEKVKTIIVGGGVAGLASAYQLREKDFLLFELSDRFGGSSSSQNHGNTVFAQGAHYDMTYPEKFGKEVLQVLEELNVIEKKGAFYEFKEKEYLISESFLTNTKYKGEYYDQVLLPSAETTKFYELLQPYYSKITLPSRLSAAETKSLNDINFKTWLIEQRINLTEQLVRGLNYHLIDDFGAGIEKVSAFAGIAYYAVRPEFGECCATFSPPEGNYYFINKFLKQLPAEKLKDNHLVTSIQKKEGQFEVSVIDVKAKKIKIFYADEVIYAGQKHALKYILKEKQPSLKHLEQAPWMVVNIVLKKDNTIPFGAWQNEDLSNETEFMGFVDSTTQTLKEDRVLTAYYCFSSADKHKLTKVAQYPKEIALQTSRNISSFFNLKEEDLISQIEKVYINLMGHAMPIPIPHYLFKDMNDNREHEKLVYAGVDNGRLPFLTEAIDSGLKAVELLGHK